MATLTFDLPDLFKLIGKKLSVDELSTILAAMGVPVEGVEGDEIEVEVFPNRPDMLSVEGVARNLRGILGIETGLPSTPLKASDLIVEVDPSTKDIRPFIVCGIARNVTFDDPFIRSVMQIQEKLHATHCRKRRKASIGIYDLDTIKGPIRYVALEPGMIEFVPLSLEGEEEYGSMSGREILIKHSKGRDYAFTLEDLPRFPILEDANGQVLSMPPIINSEETRVSEGTTNLFFDVTGTDLKTICQVLNIFCALLTDRGAEVGSVEVRYADAIMVTPELAPSTMEVDVTYITQLLGISLSDKEVVERLERMRLGVKKKGKGRLEVSIPAFRTDVMHPMDLAEDVAIGHGYVNFEPSLPAVATVGAPLPVRDAGDVVRDALVGHGFSEVITFVLTNPDRLFTRMGEEQRPVATIANPNSSEFTVVRDRLLPSLMETLERNKRHGYPQRLFEVGDIVVLDDKSDTRTRNVRRLGGAMAGTDATFAALKAVVESLGRTLGRSMTFETVDEGAFIPGRAARVLVDGTPAGVFGEVHPAVLESFALEVPVAALEFDLEVLYNGTQA